MKITKISVSSTVSKSFNHNLVSCSLGADCSLGEEDDAKAYYAAIYQKLTDKCIANVDATIAKLREQIK